MLQGIAEILSLPIHLQHQPLRPGSHAHLPQYIQLTFMRQNPESIPNHHYQPPWVFVHNLLIILLHQIVKVQGISFNPAELLTSPGLLTIVNEVLIEIDSNTMVQNWVVL